MSLAPGPDEPPAWMALVAAACVAAGALASALVLRAALRARARPPGPPGPPKPDGVTEYLTKAPLAVLIWITLSIYILPREIMVLTVLPIVLSRVLGARMQPPNPDTHSD